MKALLSTEVHQRSTADAGEQLEVVLALQLELRRGEGRRRHGLGPARERADELREEVPVREE